MLTCVALRVAPASPLVKGAGSGGTVNRAAVTARAAAAEGKQEERGPPKANAFKRRPNPPNSELRRFYERGDLPLNIDHSGVKSKLQWKVRRRWWSCMLWPSHHQH